jgi:hypothetical protein
VTGNAVSITLLTQADCASCVRAKEVVARVGADVALQVTEIDIADPEGRALAVQSGVLFAPGVLVNGAPFSYGRLSEKALRRALSTIAD